MNGEVRQLDTRIEILTPENIAFHYRLAGPFQRLIAYGIDMLIRLAVLLVMAFVLFALSIIGLDTFGVGAMLIIWFVMAWFYGGLFETLWNGQTPGKRALGLRVLTSDGRPIRGWQAILRNFLRGADAMPMLDMQFGSYQVGLWSAAMNDRFQRLGDLACHTMVVVEQRSRHRGIDTTVMATAGVRQLVQRIPHGFRPSRSLARALSMYVERRMQIGVQRRFDVASHLARPLQQMWGLPPETNPDLLLCAAYQVAFVGSDDELPAGIVVPPEFFGPASAYALPPPPLLSGTGAVGTTGGELSRKPESFLSELSQADLAQSGLSQPGLSRPGISQSGPTPPPPPAPGVAER